MKPDITAIAPFFTGKTFPRRCPSTATLGFDVTFQGPDPDDIFFGIARRGAAMIMFKDVGVRCELGFDASRLDLKGRRSKSPPGGLRMPRVGPGDAAAGRRD